MDNHEKIFTKIKNAAHNTAPDSFPSMDKVWSRVEDKLDHKVLATQSKTWKKLAVAASVLLVATLGGVLFYESMKTETPNDKIVIIEPTIVDSARQDVQTAIVNETEPNPAIKKNAGQILDKQLEKRTTVAINEAAVADDELAKDIVPPPVNAASESVTESDKSGRFLKPKIYNAKSVIRGEADAAPAFERETKSDAKQLSKKEAPLVVIDGEPMTGEKSETKVNPDLQDITILKEPLYIINGHYYTEQELFGPNPTSPYAPLNQQEIETIKILQGEKATANYGKKGEKGVVVITTKGRKPAEKPAEKGK